MFETTLIALLVPIVSGLTFVAYRHPDGYRRLMALLSPWAVGIALGFLLSRAYQGWSSLLMARTFSEQHPDWKLETIAKEVLKGHEAMGEFFNGGLIILAAVAYLAFLLLLPLILGTKGASRKK